MNYYIDFEATQFSNRIISVGCVNEKGEEFYSLVNPDRQLTKFIVELTGITQEQVDAAPSANEVFEQLFDFCSKDDEAPTFICYGDSDGLFAKATMEKIVKIYNQDFNTAIRFVFTNPLIEERDLYDKFNNLTLKIADTGMNEVVVNSPLLENYIRTEYPNYKIISSTTKCLTNPQEALNEVKKDYFLTCLDYNLNKNWNFLNSIPKEERKKVEILTNAICPSGCQNRKNHYKLNGISNLRYGKMFQASNCPIFTSTLDPVLEKGNILTKQDIFEKYYPEGFNHFKLEGRTLTALENACKAIELLLDNNIDKAMNLYNS